MNEPRIYSNIWATSQDSEATLTQNYGTASACKAQSRTVRDMCERASGLLGCGLVKAPTATMKLVAAIEPTITEKKSWLPPTITSLCPNKHRCVINPDWQNAIFAAASGSTVTVDGIIGTVTVACGKRFFTGLWPVPRELLHQTFITPRRLLGYQAFPPKTASLTSHSAMQVG
ncbi:uncharacterized protein LOC135937460 [Cloeon dipterum]|uniref:uncharacterized protein LOC135937460 n=1 Tax=Cloeon dipterum TaxID=197152 RepID=UPI0032200856